MPLVHGDGSSVSISCHQGMGWLFWGGYKNVGVDLRLTLSGRKDTVSKHHGASVFVLTVCYSTLKHPIKCLYQYWQDRLMAAKTAAKRNKCTISVGSGGANGIIFPLQRGKTGDKLAETKVLKFC